MGEAGILRESAEETHNHAVFADKHRKVEPRSILGGASSIVCLSLSTHVPVYLFERGPSLTKPYGGYPGMMTVTECRDVID
ncbi:uncharacterized protein FPRO_01323 [Fusarium proliferatum ET1]|uniref:Uncharacterized protein n=1 Tax=Fusarium proliferatum (strain ET1) TaxID=1227346 RepID=A0A1L7V4Z4_FUSPR|nr:uncharacterized protein FPRO_01323 [Fusarium proliferatum ET1]CZR34373.1 uncharacterized protein FPRO_01323 [Fusarium proliferatum ET1]